MTDDMATNREVSKEEEDMLKEKIGQRQENDEKVFPKNIIDERQYDTVA